jgi:hypothetical protein
MEDSKIWWYLILGAIYLISKFLKKKKPENAPDQGQERDAEFQQEERKVSPKKSPSSIEEILKELSEQGTQRKEAKQEFVTPKYESIPDRKPQPIQTYSRESRPIPSQVENIEAVRLDEDIDIVLHKQLLREKPEYKRSEGFKIKDNTNESANDIHETFRDGEGARKAFLYGEVFNRRY